MPTRLDRLDNVRPDPVIPSLPAPTFTLPVYLLLTAHRCTRVHWTPRVLLLRPRVVVLHTHTLTQTHSLDVNTGAPRVQVTLARITLDVKQTFQCLISC
jgi:hypothetical protein